MAIGRKNIPKEINPSFIKPKKKGKAKKNKPKIGGKGKRG